MKIVNADGILDHGMPEIVRASIGRASLDPSPSHPRREGLHVVIASRVSSANLLGGRGAPEFTSPDHQRRVEKPTLLEIPQQPGHGPVGTTADPPVICPEIRMTVPRLFLEEDLHETNSSLYQPSSKKTASAIGIGFPVTNPVELPGGLRLAIHVERLPRRKLHPGGKPVAFDPGVECGLVRSLPPVNFVELTQEPARRFGHLVGLVELRLEVKDGRTRGTKGRPLECRGKKSGGPVPGAVLGQAKGIIQDHVGGQVLVLRSQAVDGPRSQRGISHEQSSTMDLVERVVVVRMIRPHRIDQADVVGHLRKMGQRVRHPHAGLPMPLKLVLPPHDHTDVGGVAVPDLFDITGKRLAVILPQERLRIEEIHLARATVHEELDHRLRPGREMTVLRLQIIGRLNSSGASSEEVV